MYKTSFFQALYRRGGVHLSVDTHTAPLTAYNVHTTVYVYSILIAYCCTYKLALKIQFFMLIVHCTK